MRRFRFSVAFAVVLALAGCGGDDNPSGNSGALPSGVAGSRYGLANACFALKSVQRNMYAVQDAAGAYRASSATAAGAEPFFMKPTALGKYLFYAKDTRFLAVSGANAGSDAAPSGNADWTVDTNPDGSFSVVNATAAKVLAVNPDTGALVLANAAPADGTGKFIFDGVSGCTPFPEAQVNAAGDTFKGRGVDQPAVGFAEVHLHVSATNFLGGGHYGAPFHKFGVTQALGNCESVHGPMGSADTIGNILGAANPLAMHDTVGWPTFVDWPAAASLSHEATYYKWIERAWKSGLRILLNNVVENEALCMLESKRPGRDNANSCNEMDNAVAQIKTMRDMQDYIDAQEGGPGKGWFRIVENPADARKVINDGKLAVVLGIEISHLFNCKVTQIAGVDVSSDCDEAGIDKQLDRLYTLGVRQMFPIHEFDNSLGGNGIFENTGVLNAGNFSDTKSFWRTYDCPAATDPVTGGGYFFGAGAVFLTTDPSGATNPLTQGLIAAGGGGLLPIYPSTPQCNARQITTLGTLAINKMMDKKIIIELDHLEYKMKDQVMDLAAARARPAQGIPPYPVVSTHGGHGGISNAQVRRIYSLGGIVWDSHSNATQYTNRLKQLRTTLNRPNYSDPVVIPMGYGADTNGLAHQASPRGAERPPLVYPFTLFKGPQWSGPLFAGIAPITFDRQISGERTFDSNVEGLAHYGLIADWVEEVKLEGGPTAVNALFSSAEEYLRVWERTINR